MIALHVVTSTSTMWYSVAHVAVIAVLLRRTSHAVIV
jgi:hypothetical protein